MKIKLFISAFILLVSNIAYASTNCSYDIDQIVVSKNSDLVRFNFIGGATAYAYSGEGDHPDAIGRALSVALVAQAKNKAVTIIVNSNDFNCAAGSNIGRNWEYIILSK